MNVSSTADLREILADLPFLIAVAETGGVTAAADELGVPQPTVSRALARLASAVGVPLLRREGRGVALTAEARELLPYAQRAEGAVRAGLDAVRRRSQEHANTAVISFQHTLGRTLVPALLRAALDDHPDIHLHLSQGARVNCLTALVDGVADVVLVAPPMPEAAGYETVALYAEPLVLVVGPQHRLAGRTTAKVADLAAEPMLVMRQEFGLRDVVDALFDDAGIRPPIAFEGEDVQTLRGLAAAGLGVAVLPPAIPHPTDVVEIPIADPRVERVIGVSWAADDDPRPAVAAIREAVARHHEWLGGSGLGRPLADQSSKR